MHVWVARPCCCIILLIRATIPKSCVLPMWRASLVRVCARRCVQVRRVSSSKSRGLSLLSRGFGSSPRLRLHVPGQRSVISWTFLSRARPSLRHAPWLSLLLSLLQRCFRSTAGAAIPCLLSSLCPEAGGPSSISPGPSRLPDRPLPSRNPAFRCQLRVLSGLPAS